MTKNSNSNSNRNSNSSNAGADKQTDEEGVATDAPPVEKELTYLDEMRLAKKVRKSFGYHRRNMMQTHSNTGATVSFRHLPTRHRKSNINRDSIGSLTKSIGSSSLWLQTVDEGGSDDKDKDKVANISVGDTQPREEQQQQQPRPSRCLRTSRLSNAMAFKSMSKFFDEKYVNDGRTDNFINAPDDDDDGNTHGRKKKKRNPVLRQTFAETTLGFPSSCCPYWMEYFVL